MQRFHASATHTTLHGLLNGMQRLVKRNMQDLVSPCDDYTGKSAQDNLHCAFLIDSASRAIYVPCANSHPLDRPGELPQLHPQSPSDLRAIVVTESDASHTHVRRNRRGAAPNTLEWSRH
jgi:hypothetical protein